MAARKDQSDRKKYNILEIYNHLKTTPATTIGLAKEFKVAESTIRSYLKEVKKIAKAQGYKINRFDNKLLVYKDENDIFEKTNSMTPLRVKNDLKVEFKNNGIKKISKKNMLDWYCKKYTGEHDKYTVKDIIEFAGEVGLNVV